jgi:hypothetical protein
MKKIVFIVLLIPLVLFEIYLCTAFLPMHWQHAINDRVANILPKSHDTTPITHPLLDQEIEQVLHEHIGLRMVLYAVTIALLTANTWLICLIWRLLRAAQRQSESYKS